MTVSAGRYILQWRREMVIHTPNDLSMYLRVPQHELGEHKRTALEVQRARRMQRWANRFSRLSRRMSRTAHLRLARLP